MLVKYDFSRALERTGFLETLQQLQWQFYLQSRTFQLFLHNVCLESDLQSDYAAEINRSQIF